MTEVKYWIWLATRSGLKRKSAWELIDKFGNPEKIYRADKAALLGAGIRDRAMLTSLQSKDLRGCEFIIDQCRGSRFSVITPESPEYPEKLKNIYDPPIVLYVNGRLPDVDNLPTVAMVGTRKAMPYGVREARRIAGEIASAGGVIVTGLALGIDSASAQGALKAGGQVIGVLGCGLDVVYPRESEELYMLTADNGAVVSEYPPGTRPIGSNFPVRNRIISGLSDGVLVIEAPKKSGSLITANLAIEQGREVFALPGNVDTYNNEGTNALIKEGIAAVTSGEDIIRALTGDYSRKTPTAPKPAPRPAAERVSQKMSEKPVDRQPETEYIETEYIEKAKSLEGLSEDELKVLGAITRPKTHVDDIIDTTGVAAAKVLSSLTTLEIKGYVKREAGKRFSLNLK